MTRRRTTRRRTTGRRTTGRRTTGGPARCRSRGSATIWVVSLCALLVVIATVVTVRGLAVLARHRAEAAADLAALAAAGRIGLGGDACAAARRTAAANDATVTSCRLTVAADGRTGTVTIRVVGSVRLPVVGRRAVTASARAGRMPANPAGVAAAGGR
jgi:secretion/DNA translocation related TadE-like protein